MAAVLLDMGLGKTSITLTALNSLLFDSFEIHRVLVVAPIRVASFSWPAEIEKWDNLEGLKYSVAVGTAAERLAALRKQADIYLINRENVQWLVSESGIPFDFDMVVFSYKPLPGAERQIYGRISDITISMKSTDHLQMPELINSRYTVYLSEKEDSRYADLKKDLVLQLLDGEITAANAASLSGKLSQMANGAVYTDAGETVAIHERKLDALEDIIEAANGKQVLVAYWFRHDLERITERLHKLKIPCSRLDTDGSIQKWNSGEIPVALIHPASAGHGLNLQSGGNTLVWFGLTWSLELYQQTVARLWRQGQASKTVVVQHIITKGTIDERIMKALSEKDTTQAALIDAVKADLKIKANQ